MIEVLFMTKSINNYNPLKINSIVKQNKSDFVLKKLISFKFNNKNNCKWNIYYWF